jgi:hypothetical protein
MCFLHRRATDDLRHTHDLGRKEAAHTRCSDSGSKGSQDLIPQRDESDWAGTANAVTSVSAGHGADLWAWLDLNQRPHPYQAYSRDAFMLVVRRRPARERQETDRGCPLGTVIDPSIWHANGTTDEGK